MEKEERTNTDNELNFHRDVLEICSEVCRKLNPLAWMPTLISFKKQIAFFKTFIESIKLLNVFSFCRWSIIESINYINGPCKQIVMSCDSHLKSFFSNKNLLFFIIRLLKYTRLCIIFQLFPNIPTLHNIYGDLFLRSLDLRSWPELKIPTINSELKR